MLKSNLEQGCTSIVTNLLTSSTIAFYGFVASYFQLYCCLFLKRTESQSIGIFALRALSTDNNAFLSISETWIYGFSMVLHQTSVVTLLMFCYYENDLCICCCVMWFWWFMIFRWIWLFLQSLSGTREVRSDRQTGLWFFTETRFQWIACLWWEQPPTLWSKL